MSTAADSEQQRYLRSLQSRVRWGRQRGLWLAVATAATVLVSLIVWSIHYVSSVLSYARVDPSIRIERGANDPDRLFIFFQPNTGGIVGFRREDADRETELLDEVQPEATASEQKFEWRWNGVETGSVLRVTFRQGWSLVTKELAVPEPPQVPPLGSAVLDGEVVNATNNQPVADAKIIIVGTPLIARTGSDGGFRLAEAPAGPVSVEVSAPGFSTDQIEKQLAPEGTTTARFVLSPGLKAGQVRIVLTWGSEPKDLDAHLKGPLPEEKKFHVYFKEKGDLLSREFVNLDVDALKGNGPETITVLGVLPGTYHYFVHDYTNRNATDNRVLSHCGAEVKVYQGGQARVYRTNNRSIGNVWHVCDIEVPPDGPIVVRKIDRYETKRMKTQRSGTVVLLIDISGSMSSLIGTTKEACFGFLDKVPLEEGAKAGLATFGRATKKQHDISNDRDSLRRAIEPLRVGNGTPMAQGLVVAHDMLKGLQGSRCIVLFTDGKPDQRGSVIPAAEKIKEDGIVVWAIGTANADMGLLRRLTSSPDKAIFASPEDLREVFGSAAGKIYAPAEEDE